MQDKQDKSKKVIPLPTSSPVSKDYKNKWIENFVNAGYSLFPLWGKFPAKSAKNWQNTPYDPTIDGEDLPDNYGVVLKEDDLVIDVDPRNFVKCLNGKLVTIEDEKPVKKVRPEEIGLNEGDEDNPIPRLFQQIGLPKKPNTLIVKTGGGGLHMWFKIPAGTKIRNDYYLYPGIEFKSKGRFLVGAGSIHPDTKQPYKVLKGNPRDILEAPEDLLEVASRETTQLKGLDEAKDDAGSEFRYINYLKNAPLAVEKCMGDFTTYKTAAIGRDFGLSPEKTYELLTIYWNPRCQPPWDLDDLRTKVNNVYEYATNKPGALHPESDFKNLVFEENDELQQKELKYFRWVTVSATNKNPKPNDLGNTVNFFLRPNIEAMVNPLYRLIRYNEFADQIEFNFPAPWHNLATPPKYWSDMDTINLKYWLSQVRHYTSSINTCLEAVTTVDTMYYPYHPVRDYLNSLKWDGIVRLPLLLPDYAGTKDDLYTRAVGKNTILGAVARIYQPGCQFDHILVLEGEQGTGKSSFVRVLGDAFYKDIVIDPHNKDTIDAIKGGWIIEASEMDFGRQSGVQGLKAFTTRVSDFVRPAYGRTTVEFKRQCVFIGTHNPDQTGTYLTDQTGNRRFWPVATTEIKLEELKKDRDQLFAEAVHRYKKGEAYHLVNITEIKAAQDEQDSRTIKDEWLHIIRKWFIRLERGEIDAPHIVPLSYIASEALNIPARQITKTVQSRIHYVMHEIGYPYGRFYCRTEKLNVTGFKRPVDALDGL